MNESEGRVALKRCFEAAGYTITEDYTFDCGAVAVSLDGYDPARKVGYEFITTEAGDREEFSQEAVRALEAGMRRREFYVFLVDERGVDETWLLRAARRFLDAVNATGDGP